MGRAGLTCSAGCKAQPLHPPPFEHLSWHSRQVAPDRLQTLRCCFAACRCGIECKALRGTSATGLAVKRRCLQLNTSAPVASALPDGLFSLSFSSLRLLPLPQTRWRGKTLAALLVPAHFGCVVGETGHRRTRPAWLRSLVVSRPEEQGVCRLLSRAERPRGLSNGCSWFLCLWGALEPPERQRGPGVGILGTPRQTINNLTGCLILRSPF